MAGPLDFFSPGPWTDPNQPDASSQLSQTFNDPRAKAALLQAGLSLMAGPTWGDTGASQLARAVGTGGEAVGRGEAMDIKAQEADSKDQLREAQAGAATARSGQAATQADLARERLGIARVAEQGKTDRNTLGGRIRLSGMYQQYLKDLAKRNADVMKPPGSPAEVPLDMQNWIKNNPTLNTLGLIPPGAENPAPEEGIDTPQPLTPTVSTSAPQVGETRKGYRFKGGDPALATSWDKI